MKKFVELPHLEVDDLDECHLLAENAERTKRSERGRAGRESTRIIQDFELGFESERSLSSFLGPEAKRQCVAQQKRGAAYGPDFLKVDTKAICAQLSDSQDLNGVLRRDMRLAVKQHVLANDKVTQYYALVVRDHGCFFLVGWTSREDLMLAYPWGTDSRALKISQLRDPEQFAGAVT